MSRRKHSPLHDFWHPRVEGQIRHTMNVHPEWFTFKDAKARNNCVNSLAKRIVGEIVAGRKLASVLAEDVAGVSEREGNDGRLHRADIRPEGDLRCAPDDPH